MDDTDKIQELEKRVAKLEREIQTKTTLKEALTEMCDLLASPFKDPKIID
jgi:hypothetical protein